jgi:hypothetical protein
MKLVNEIRWKNVKLLTLVNIFTTIFQRVRLMFSSEAHVNCDPSLHIELSDAQHSGQVRIIALKLQS